LEEIKTQEPRPPRQLDDAVPAELDRICLRALAKRASDRYSTAHDLGEDLRDWLAGGGAARGAGGGGAGRGGRKRAGSPLPPPPPPPRRPPSPPRPPSGGPQGAARL